MTIRDNWRCSRSDGTARAHTLHAVLEDATGNRRGGMARRGGSQGATARRQQAPAAACGGWRSVIVATRRDCAAHRARPHLRDMPPPRPGRRRPPSRLREGATMRTMRRVRARLTRGGTAVWGCHMRPLPQPVRCPRRRCRLRTLYGVGCVLARTAPAFPRVHAGTHRPCLPAHAPPRRTRRTAPARTRPMPCGYRSTFGASSASAGGGAASSGRHRRCNPSPKGGGGGASALRRNRMSPFSSRSGSS